MSHNMFEVVVSLLFLAGFLMHCIKCAGVAKRSGVSPSIGGWFVQYWWVLVVRLSVLYALFIMYATNENLMDKIFAQIGFTETYSLPVTKVTSFLFGFLSDSILDIISPKIPWLNRDIPTYNEEKKPAAEVKTTA